MQIVIEIPEWFKEMIDKGEAPLEFPLFLAYGIQQGIIVINFGEGDMPCEVVFDSTGMR